MTEHHQDRRGGDLAFAQALGRIEGTLAALVKSVESMRAVDADQYELLRNIEKRLGAIERLPRDLEQVREDLAALKAAHAARLGALERFKMRVLVYASGLSTGAGALGAKLLGMLPGA